MDKQADRKEMEPGSNIFHRLNFQKSAGDSTFENENVPCNTPIGSFDSRVGGPLAKMASNSVSHGITSMSSEEYIRDPSSILSLQPWIFKRSGSHKDDGKNIVASGGLFDKGATERESPMGSSIVKASPRSVGLSGEPGRGLSSLRSRRPRKQPVTSMENCLIPQLYNENFEIEEYVFSPFSPTVESARPFIITNGRKIINRSSYEPLAIPFNVGLHNEVYQGGQRTREMVAGVSPLPELRKMKQNSRDMHHERLDIMSSKRSKQLHSKGPLDRMLLFSIGIHTGILFSALSSKTEMDNLKDMLKCSENLVQDLHEELEMRESLTVKELSGEGSEGKEDENNQQQVPNSEPMSKIEAELEAELEKLNFNVTSSCLEGRMSAMSEVDPELIGDVVHGELKADLLHHGDPISDDDRRHDSKSSSTGCGCADEATYPVSPRTLSLRLHEVIQQRLQDRIKELEIALAQSQKQLQMVESERVFSERTFSNNSEIGSSSNQESPRLLFRQENSSSVQPFCINLSGDALNAYDEALEEFLQIAEGEGDVPDTANVKDTDLKPLKRVPTWEHILKRSSESSGGNESDGDESDDDDGKFLIQQIVERTKQGSPVLIHAQRILLSVDE